jgi:hypothetical protein
VGGVWRLEGGGDVEDVGFETKDDMGSMRRRARCGK